MQSSVTKPSIAPTGLDGLNALWASFDELRKAVTDIADLGGPEIAEEANRIASKIDSFEPTVTMIGQIKAGKTALVNAMIGQTDLLPSDVNPWTSVVTSLHLNSRNRPEGTQALFRFFDEEEWDRLVSTGGRLGELAQRAGFESEQDAVRDQVLAMREKSRVRLGKKFELLLGTSHTYDMVTRDLIDRYVCYGGWDDAEDNAASRGRYADITKLANLYLDLPGYPSGLCLRDTPGVNDTFMMREQITLNSIRDSRLCVVVLSAHQALSTMDMALLRLVAAVDARELVIFVNRIDELDDPANQVAEIGANFRETLKKHDIGIDVPIVFGSALWALAALDNSTDELPAPSRLALLNWSNANPCPDETDRETQQDRAWRLCGVPQLHKLVATCIVAGPGRAMQREARDALSNLVTSIEASDFRFGLSDVSFPPVDTTALAARIDEVEHDMAATLANANKFAVDSMSERLKKSQSMFCDRAVEALQSHIDAYGTGKAWQYNPAGLRMMLRTAYKTFCSDVEREAEEIYGRAARRIEGLYTEMFGIEPGRIVLRPPAPAHAPPPTGVGKTIALDLNVSWWRKWWQGVRRQEPTAERYAALIAQETDSILDELSAEMGPELCRENEAILTTFVEAQRANLLSLAEGTGSDDGKQSGRTADKIETLRATRDLVDAMAA